MNTLFPNHSLCFLGETRRRSEASAGEGFLTDLRALLRTETGSLHTRLEALPFFQALHAGILPRLAIVSFLRSFAVIHAVLERELSANANGDVAALREYVLPKVPFLVADLEALGTETLPSIAAAVQIAVDCGAWILTRADHPLSLIGTLYVLEGSQNGGVILKQAYATCLNVPLEQLSFFGCYGRETTVHWNAFGERLNSLQLEGDQADQVTRSAVHCFEWLEKICAALYPYSDESLKHHVAGINFEAGDHAMPQNPFEIALALRSGRAAWEHYPYLERRFGDRGKRFTSSDSCWLVALTRMPVDTATKSLEWLRTVLASRGIPTVILEWHLRAISQALAVDFPEQKEMQARFDRFLSGLETERRAIAGGETSRLVEQFNRRFCACQGLVVDSAAGLIASAWVDEHAGIRGALAAARDWFIDDGRFSRDWIGIVNDLVTELDQAGGSSC